MGFISVGFRAALKFAADVVELILVFIALRAMTGISGTMRDSVTVSFDLVIGRSVGR